MFQTAPNEDTQPVGELADDTQSITQLTDDMQPVRQLTDDNQPIRQQSGDKLPVRRQTNSRSSVNSEIEFTRKPSTGTVNICTPDNSPVASFTDISVSTPIKQPNAKSHKTSISSKIA